MTKAKKKLTLSRVMIAQIQAYAMDCEENGWYYGNRGDFWKRHQAIKAWLKQEMALRTPSAERADETESKRTP